MSLILFVFLNFFYICILTSLNRIESDKTSNSLLQVDISKFSFKIVYFRIKCN